ncbi:MAG: sugar ABC transporter permease [Clostridia bacterium]|nr:sugar ABC transporter permease [Clostridia bacterium]MBQ8758172.1 sugar ABC transporter permease [Clostridia bacterium]
MNNTASVEVVKKKKPASLDAKKARAGWFFVLPFLIGFIILYIPMLISSVEFSFSKIHVIPKAGYELEFIGIENYREALFSDANFVRTLTESIQQLVLDVPAIVIFSLFMAIVLNQKMLGRAVFRAIFFIPVILATGLIDQIDQSNAAMNYMNSGGIDTGAGGAESEGLINTMDITNLLGNMVIGTELVEYVVGIVNNIFNIVNRSGVQMLIFLSGLQSISPAIYESCKMDGATGWETFWKITFPMISPMILVNTIYTVIDSFTSESNVVMTYINKVYNEGTLRPRELSSAMSWIYFLIVLVLIGLVSLLVSAFVFYQRRD